MNKYLIKIAADKDKQKEEKLQKHTQGALDKLEREKGLLVHHSLGSGKTLLFLKAIERYQKAHPNGQATIIAPASLVTNVDKEIKKHGIKGINRKNLEVLSYQKAYNDIERLHEKPKGIVVVDEAHGLRNKDSSRAQILKPFIQGAEQRVLTTATGNYNHIADISPLVNMAAGKDILPEDRKEMEKQFVEKGFKKQTFVQSFLRKEKEPLERLKNTDVLGRAFKKHVHYYNSEDDPEAAKNFPKLEEETVETEMSPEQNRYYRYAENNIPFLLRMKIRANLPLDRKEKAQVNSFSTGVRQVSTGYRHLHEKGDVEYSPKVLKAVENLQAAAKGDKNFRGLVYSNYIGAGLKEYSKKLEEEGVSHAIYDGSLTRTEKDELVENYNKGKKKVLLISSAGAEGLNTKGTKMVQTLESHFNPAKLDQVVGRARRFKSHTHLPEEERKVKVQHYLSVHKKDMFGKAPTSIDKYLHDHSDKKQEMFDQMKALLKEHGK